ncbi:Ribosomal protein L1p/L10e-like protein [Dinothrombium tinctorium]|uniref:Ribosomal protein L1p/L10e-like protein n=1 Tax=Dinothrombium tinctorium TaxID=1965070 RepID=A0A3S3P9M7_9ACAR|nr:Ribosomal protein L1p/L10e-like protein [Dinothrombium tinctorium]RWS17944.1 Ribosomal protein L1p/L10e-like protein [Dinothrombium tinctorium]
MFPNWSTFTHVIGPIPHPFATETDIDVCLIVRDLEPKNFLPDREFDLNQTREYYTQKLRAAGFSDDFITQRIYILPMRELFTEFREYEAKRKLCDAYDLFLADRSLMNNKFKALNLFLGSKFFVERKKMPIPVQIRKLEGEELKQEISDAFSKIQICMTGRGNACTVQIGKLGQSVDELSANLSFVLKEVKHLFKNNVGMLRLKTAKSFAIPIFADLGSKSDVDLKSILPRNKLMREGTEDEFPLFNHSNVIVYPSGDVRFKKTESENANEEDVDDEKLSKLEDKWVRITNKRKRKQKWLTKPLGKRMKRDGKRRKVEKIHGTTSN